MITAEQKQARKKFIGSSDMSAILGLNPDCSAYDVWLEKSDKLDEWKGNDATEAGVYLEPVVLQWAEDRMNVKLDRHGMHVHDNRIMGCNLDGEGEGPEGRFVVEAKTSGIVGPIYGDWGTPGTSEVPEMHIIQVMHQLACTGYSRGYVAALIGGRGFCMYQIDRSEEFCSQLERQAKRFWGEHVMTGNPPPDSLPSLEIARRIKRQPGLIVAIDADVCDELVSARDARAKARQREDELKAKFLAMANGADAIRRGMDGEILFTNNPNKNGVRSLRFKGEAA